MKRLPSHAPTPYKFFIVKSYREGQYFGECDSTPETLTRKPNQTNKAITHTHTHTHTHTQIKNHTHTHTQKKTKRKRRRRRKK